METLQINLNLKDLFVEEQTDEGYVEIGLADAIKQSLISEARNKIRELVGTKVDELLAETFRDRFELIINAMADKHMESFQESAEFKERYKLTTLSDLIESKISRLNFDSKAEHIVKTLADKHMLEIKQRFDERYAAGVVEGLNKNGLLNKHAANLLISKSSDAE